MFLDFPFPPLAPAPYPNRARPSGLLRRRRRLWWERQRRLWWERRRRRPVAVLAVRLQVFTARKLYVPARLLRFQPPTTGTGLLTVYSAPTPVGNRPLLDKVTCTGRRPPLSLRPVQPRRLRAAPSDFLRQTEPESVSYFQLQPLIGFGTLRVKVTGSNQVYVQLSNQVSLDS